MLEINENCIIGSHDIVSMYPTAIRQFFDTGEMEDSLFDDLFNYYLDSGDMPYGVAKAREGDPHQWVADHFERDFKNDVGSINETYSKKLVTAMTASGTDNKSTPKPNGSKFSNYNDDDLVQDDPADKKAKETQISELMKLAGVKTVESIFDESELKYGGETTNFSEGDPVTIVRGMKHKGNTGTVVEYSPENGFVLVQLDNGTIASFQNSDVEYNDEADDLEDEARGAEGYDQGDFDDDEHEFDEQVIHVNKDAFESIAISNGKLVIKGEKIIPTLDRKNRIWTASIWSAKKIF